MRIAANAVAYPGRIVTNDAVCALVRANSGDSRTPSHTVALVESYLDKLGARERHWLADGERAIDVIGRAAADILKCSGVPPGAIDNLIYCGVDRALIEPANAALIAFELGMPAAKAFDVVHACQGWFTSLQIAGDRADLHGETTLIVSAEFPMSAGGATYPKNFDLSNMRDDHWKFATLVLGEAAAATLVVPGGAPLVSRQRSDNAGYRASYVRLPNANRFLLPTEPDFATPELTFYSNSDALVEHGMAIGIETLEALHHEDDGPIVVIPHTISSRVVRLLGERYHGRFPIVDIFPQTGNIGTASLPAGLHRLGQTDGLAEGRRPVGWMIAAGMTAVAFEFPLVTD